MNKTLYLIIEEDNPHTLANEVEAALERGWKLQGGPLVNEGIFYQALTKLTMVAVN